MVPDLTWSFKTSQITMKMPTFQRFLCLGALSIMWLLLDVYTSWVPLIVKNCGHLPHRINLSLLIKVPKIHHLQEKKLTCRVKSVNSQPYRVGYIFWTTFLLSFEDYRQSAQNIWRTL